MRRGRSDIDKAIQAACIWSGRSAEQVLYRLDDDAVMAVPRLRAVAAAILEELEREGAGSPHVMERMRRRVQQAATSAAQSDVSAESAPLVDVLERRVGLHGAAVRARETELLEAIFADPDDDALRSVYADWLVERGDPRGELIALQLRPDVARTKKRQAELVTTYGEAWLAGLVGLVDHAIWRRGFVAECRYAGNYSDWTFDRPEWATVEVLEFPYTSDASRDVARGRFRALRRLACVDWNGIYHLAAEPRPFRLRHVAFSDHHPPDRARLSEAAAAHGLRDLERVDFVDNVLVDDDTRRAWLEELLARTVFGERLRHVGVSAPPAHLSRWLRWFRGQSTLESLSLGLASSWRFAVESVVDILVQRGDGRSLDVSLSYVPRGGDSEAHLQPWLAVLATFLSPDDDKLTITVPPRARLAPQTRDQIRSLVQPYPAAR